MDVGIHARLADALPLLISAIDGKVDASQDWADRITEVKSRREAEYRQRLGPQLEWLGAIRDALPSDGIFVDELTQTGYVSRFAFPSYRPRSFISTGYQGTLGYGFATALGVAHARRDVPVVSISGDGGALFTITELATAVHHRIRRTTVIFNDHALAMCGACRWTITIPGSSPLTSAVRILCHWPNLLVRRGFWRPARTSFVRP